MPPAWWPEDARGPGGGTAIDIFRDEPTGLEPPPIVAHRTQPDWAAGRILVVSRAASRSPQSWRERREEATATARDARLRGEVRNCVNTRFLSGFGLRGSGKTV